MRQPNKETNDSTQVCAISGLVVCAMPARMDEVAQTLNNMPGVEVHDRSTEGKMVVTVEELPGEKMMVDRISEISAAEGVLSSALVYTHQE
ncbi:glutamate synthase [Endozoicomonas sp. OPT23]|uniref:chaperone NapD n=1 Tax=Endozoicomonas sp. OPT23 TaxID=2072845 RepID=UPI00129B3444|nr:chaperone NapD [Endozoicomonas sp. OPT23]MRI32411.1 glutamate synthase [Endozoicomonas sp. OPT23]